MEFDKSKILTVVTADQLRECQLGWTNDRVNWLKKDVETTPPYLVETPNDGYYSTEFPFYDSKSCCHRRYFYPAPEPTYAERQAEWIKENGLKVGDEVWITRPWKAGEDGADCEDCYRSSGMVEAVVNVKEIREKYILIEGGVFSTHHWACPYTALGIIKEPTYRPFKNAEEFKPYRDEWFRVKHDGGMLRICAYNDEGVQGANGRLNTYQIFFEKAERENGEPCGVREDK